MKPHLFAMATTLAALTLPAGAFAAELRVEPAKRCYGSGEKVNLLGTGFTPGLMSGINVTRDGESIGTLSTDTAGAFNGDLTLGQENGRRTSTYTAADTSNPTLTASTQIVVSEVDVQLRPKSGAPGRRVTIDAVGFTEGGDDLWAHIVRGSSVRHVRVGGLERACRRVRAKRRLLPSRAPAGTYTIQFDAFRKYDKDRTQKAGYLITVRRVASGAVASVAGSPLR